MTTSIAVIDPFIKSPAIHCFNGLVETLDRPLTYYQPSVFGISGLFADQAKNQAYIVLGSASHVHENLTWHKPLADFLLGELKKNKPVLGCCFGHQLVCYALGSEVNYFEDENTKLQGQRKIVVSKDFWNFKRGEIFDLAVTHKQVVKKLAPGLIEVGEGLSNDLVIHESLPFLGTQAHPEASTYFCENDIQGMPQELKIHTHREGQRLIQRFFKHFGLI